MRKRVRCSPRDDREPELEQVHAVADEHPFEARAPAAGNGRTLVRAEAHDALDAGAVVPGAVEEHDLAGARQVRHVALEVPLARLRSRWACSSATTRAPRGLRCSVKRLIVPPLPAASRPSKRIATRWPVSLTQSCIFSSSICSRRLSTRTRSATAARRTGSPRARCRSSRPSAVTRTGSSRSSLSAVSVNPSRWASRSRPVWVFASVKTRSTSPRSTTVSEPCAFRGRAGVRFSHGDH